MGKEMLGDPQKGQDRRRGSVSGLNELVTWKLTWNILWLLSDLWEYRLHL